MAILKAGAVYPDEKASGLSNKDEDNTEYHGGYKDEYGNEVNYVACYELMTRIALKYGNAESITEYKSIWGISKISFDWIRYDFDQDWVGDRTWGAIFAELGVSDTRMNRRYFTWGIALHILADTFSHDTYRKKDKVRIVHKDAGTNEILGADDKDVVKGRWEAAKLAIKASVECLETATFGDFREIEYALKNQPLTNNSQLFLKKRLLQCMIANGGTAKLYVKNANID